MVTSVLIYQRVDVAMKNEKHCSSVLIIINQAFKKTWEKINENFFIQLQV